MRAGEPRAMLDAWVEPLKWAALAVWLAIPLLGIFAQPVAGRVTWTMGVAAVPIFIVLIGYHRWRRLCPLAFFAQLPARLGRPGARRVPDWLEQRYYFVPLGLFTLGLWFRLIATNGDGVAIALFFVGISIVALVVGGLFTGKTWCNYLCPVSFIEKIYTEPYGLRETPNSQCTKCTACKKACPDINQENGYWKEILLPSKKTAYFAYPGLVFGFYFYYFLQSGTWDYYFGGTWTNELNVLQSPGFFFLPQVPRAIAALLTLMACGTVSCALFIGVEHFVKRWLRRGSGSSVEAGRVRSITFALVAFTAFVTFYSFAGQPTLRQIAWLPTYVAVLTVGVGTLILVRRIRRTQAAFAEQSVARNILKRWEWSDTPPPSDLHDAYLVHVARSSERDRASAALLDAYREAVRETLADGLVTVADVQRLEALRARLQIKPADHERVMRQLTEDERVLLAGPSHPGSAEKRLQYATYMQALEAYLTSTAAADDAVLRQLRSEFGIAPQEHVQILTQIVGDNRPASKWLTDTIASIERASATIAALGSVHSPTSTLLRDLLRDQRVRAVRRLVRSLDPAGDLKRVEPVLTADEPEMRSSGFEALLRGLPEPLATRLQRAPSFDGRSMSVAEQLTAHTNDADPFVQAAAQQLLVERGIAPRQPSASVEPGLIERMAALHAVPLFSGLDPVALASLARASRLVSYAAGEELCTEGEPGSDAIVILSGEVEVWQGSRLLRTQSAGEVIGEMAVLDPAPRSATVRATTEQVTAVRLDGAAFQSALATDPAAARRVLQTLVRRVRATEQRVPT